MRKFKNKGATTYSDGLVLLYYLYTHVVIQVYKICNGLHAWGLYSHAFLGGCKDDV